MARIMTKMMNDEQRALQASTVVDDIAAVSEVP